MSKISKKCLTYAVNFLNCQLNLNLKVKEQKGEFFIAPENEINTLDNIYLSITKNDKNGYKLTIENAQNNIDFNKLQKSIVEISSDFIISIAENDVVCETIKYLCKTAKYIWWRD